jgi:hypothetical protein
MQAPDMATKLTRLSQRRFVDALLPWLDSQLMGHQFGRPSLDQLVNGNEAGSVLVNYLIRGLEPGSFYCSVFANDMFAAVTHAHPAVNMAHLKPITGFMAYHFPEGTAWGSKDAVNHWTGLTDEERLAMLCERGLWLTPEQEMWVTLQGFEYHTADINWNQIPRIK